MLAQDPQPAPADVFVRYLAVFHRFLTALVQYTDEDDKPGMLLGGCLAEELRNVPALLWYYDEDVYRKPALMNRYT